MCSTVFPISLVSSIGTANAQRIAPLGFRETLVLWDWKGPASLKRMRTSEPALIQQRPTSNRNPTRAHTAMAMAAAACKPLNSLPSSLQTQRSHCGALYPRQQIKCLSYHRHARSPDLSCKLLRHKRESARRVCIRAVPEGDEDWENCNRCNKCDKCDKEVCNKCNKCHDCTKKDKEENLKTDEPSWEEITETKSRESSEQSEPVRREKEEQQQQSSSAGEEEPSPTVGRFHCFARKVGLCDTTSSRDEELKKPELQTGSKVQGVCSKLRYWWRGATRPQNLLAAFLAGLLLYAFALFGWQVMVVAADVTLYVLKCCFVAIFLLFLYILLI